MLGSGSGSGVGGYRWSTCHVFMGGLTWRGGYWFVASAFLMGRWMLPLCRLFSFSLFAPLFSYGSRAGLIEC